MSGPRNKAEYEHLRLRESLGRCVDVQSVIDWINTHPSFFYANAANYWAVMDNKRRKHIVTPPEFHLEVHSLKIEWVPGGSMTFGSPGRWTPLPEKRWCGKMLYEARGGADTVARTHLFRGLDLGMGAIRMTHKDKFEAPVAIHREALPSMFIHGLLTGAIPETDA